MHGRHQRSCATPHSAAAANGFNHAAGGLQTPLGDASCPCAYSFTPTRDPMSVRISGGLAIFRCCCRYQQLLIIHEFYFCDICHKSSNFLKLQFR
jgi:hypothetical protein